MNHPHHSPSELRLPEEESMPPTIKFFAQAIALQTPGELATPSQTSLNMKAGHKEFFINTIVAYVMSLHDILYLWRIRMVNGEVGDLSSISTVNLYPLSPLQRAILNDITTALTSRQQTQAQFSEEDTLEISNWRILVPANPKS